MKTPKNLALKGKLFMFALGLLVILFIPLLYTPFFTEPSNIGAIILDQMDKCIKDGQIPCRWVPDLGGLYGYPLFNYYAPLPFYVGEVINLLSHDLLFSVRAMFSLTFFGSFFFMYLLSGEFLASKKAFVLSLLFSFFSHLILGFYVKDPAGKLWFLMSLPLLGYSFCKLSKQKNVSNIIFCAVSAFILLTSYYLSIFVYVFLLPLFIVFLYFKTKADNKFLLYSFLAVILGITLASFYILPMVFEKDLVHSDTKTYGYLPIYAKEYPSQSKLERYQILAGSGYVTDFKNGTNWFSFRIESEERTIVRISQYYFPDWKIFVNGKETKFEYTNNSLGLMTLILGDGSFFVQGYLFNTPVRVVANLISLFSALFLILLILIRTRAIKKWFTYYLKAIN